MSNPVKNDNFYELGANLVKKYPSKESVMHLTKEEKTKLAQEVQNIITTLSSDTLEAVQYNDIHGDQHKGGNEFFTGSNKKLILKLRTLRSWLN